MSHIKRFFLLLCAVVLTCMLWSQAPASTTYWRSHLTSITSAEYKKEVNTGRPRNVSTESGSYQEHQKTLEWEAEQKRRKVVLKRACQKWLPKDKGYLPKGKNGMLRLLVDDSHKAIYCYVPKVSCTNWKRIWMILTGMNNTKNPLDIPEEVPHNLQHEMMLVNQPYDNSVLQSKVDSYTKFMVVRDPYERLLSAYRNKLEHGKNNSHWKKYVNDTINYNKKQGMSANMEITFPAFVNYLIGLPKSRFDDHWRSYHDLCYPCAIKYDVIAKYETLVEDSNRILRLIGAPDDLHFPPYVASKTSSLMPQYMANLSQAQYHGLYQVYRRDFEAFEYKPFGGSE